MRTPRPWCWIIGILVLWSAPALADDGRPEVDARALLDEAWKLTARHYYDKPLLEKKGWKAIGARYRKKAEQVEGQAAVHALINAMLGELKTSHLVLMDREVFRRTLRGAMRNERYPRLGVEFTAIEGRLFADKIQDGGPAQAAGIQSGDELVRIAGRPAMEAPRLRESGHDPGLAEPPGYMLIVDQDEPVTLTLRRKAEGPLEEVKVRARTMNMVDAIKSSVRIIERGARRIGVIHLWHLLHGSIFGIVERALDGPLADADGLILDIRGRGGYSELGHKIQGLFQGDEALWKKPVVVLSDRGTRSAKEIFAWWWRQRKLGPIVGERTRGACISAMFKTLSDGSEIMLPAGHTARKSGGVFLEARGVAPDIPVAAAALPYRGGKDSIFERGLAVLEQRIRARPRAGARLY